VSTSSEPLPAPAPAMIHPLSLLKRFWLILVLVLIGVGYGIHSFRWAFQDQGYAPTQPIAYSHKLHAGELKIDCQFCHSGASRGMHAGIPPMETCLGCHKQVATAKPEIQKLIAIADKGSYEDNGVTKEGGQVHWNRVHRLPDHVYFSHEWHTKAGVACQTCHGPVEEMTAMRQYSDLTMGWCLDCHRKSNYVGGREYQPGKPETFTVGTGDYTVANARQDPDPVVEFHERRLAGRDGQPSKPTTVGQVPTTVAQVETHAEKLQKLIATKPEWRDLPSWRISDLPATHQKIYGDERFMNAPTQCSTCHQ
jgi:Cytochrome c7 and related cytochrome c